MEHKEIAGSSSVKSAGYDPQNKTLEIRYHGSGKTYSYANVPYDIHARLMLASSAGKFVYKNIMPHYAAKEVA